MKVFVIPNIIIIFTTIILSILIIAKNKKAAINRLQVIFNLGIALWSFSFIKIISAPDRESGLFWGKLIYIGTILIPLFFLHFTLEYLKESRKEKQILIGYLLSIPFLISLNTDWLIRDVKPLPPMNYYPIPGRLHLLFFPYFFGLLTYTLYRLFKSLKDRK